MPNIVGFKGRYNGPNELSDVPVGALDEAQNCVIRSKGVIESRRGQSKTKLTYNAATQNMLVNNMFSYQGRILAHVNIGSAPIGFTPWKMTVWDNAGNLTSLQSTTLGDPADDTVLRTKATESRGNLFFTSQDGIQVLDTPTTNAVFAGCPPGIGLASIFRTGSTTGTNWLASGSSVAYRHTWCRKTADGRIIEGAPSARRVFTNTGIADDVSMTLFIPSSVTTNHFYRIYRTESVATGLLPAEDYFLVYEGTLTGVEISSGISNVIEDITPDIALAEGAYFGQNNEGILASNLPPPFATDLCEFDGRTWFANTRQPQALKLTIIGLDPTGAGTGGVRQNDRLILSFVNPLLGTITLKATTSVTPNPALGEFRIYSTGTPSQNLKDTAASLVYTINYLGTNNPLLYAELASDDLTPGTFIVRGRDVRTEQFYATSPDRGGAFSPTLPDNGTRVSSDSDARSNRVHYSKFQKPEACPLLNYVDVGPSDCRVLRIVPLRDRLFVFTDRGLYVIGSAGLSGGYSVSEYDLTVVLLAPDTVASVANQLYAFTNQGVVGISDSGVRVVSGRIDRDAHEFTRLATDLGLARQFFAVPYETEHQYILFVPDSNGNVARAFVLHVLSGDWTTWEDMKRVCGVVRPVNDQLLLAESVDTVSPSYMRSEWKTLTSEDYYDEEFASSVVAYNASTLTVAMEADTPCLPGDLIVNSTKDSSALVSSYNENLSTATLFEAPSVAWEVTDELTVRRAIPCYIRVTPYAAGSPDQQKQFTNTTAFFNSKHFYAPKLEFTSDLVSDVTTQTLNFTDRTSHLVDPGQIKQWSAQRKLYNKRVTVPPDKQRCNYLSIGFRITEACSMWALAGLGVEISGATERNSR